MSRLGMIVLEEKEAIRKVFDECKVGSSSLGFRVAKTGWVPCRDVERASVADEYGSPTSLLIAGDGTRMYERVAWNRGIERKDKLTSSSACFAFRIASSVLASPLPSFENDFMMSAKEGGGAG
jgi:hypothetical protein